MSSALPQLPWFAAVALLAGLLLCWQARADADLPPAGRSLFDHLTTDARGIQRVPFPFTALMARIEREVGPDALGHAGVRSLLIPLGRSLQRNASIAEAWRYPRVVAAVVGEPRAGAPLLKDRLYLGYHEKAGVLEVISYNEAAGRFEFQLVKDYRAGATPRVFHAQRTVCLACHHGAAPIFSRPGWDETNANPRVAAQLARTAAVFHGVPARRSLDEANVIDDAIVRAARFETTQRIWREGCAPEAAIECRARAFEAALRHRIGASDGRGTARLRELLAAAARWPDGLPLRDAEIPNRDPLAVFAVGREDFSDRAALLRMADIRPAFDPLQPRVPLGRWRATDAAAVAAYVRDVALFFSQEDIAALARALRDRDAGALTRAIAGVAASTRAGHSDALADAPLRRGALLRALFAQLRVGVAPACCDDPLRTAPAALDLPERVAPVELPPPLALLRRHCGACHATREEAPPGFLLGEADEVSHKVARCAPRIAYRLAMWQRPPEARPRTPMPPPTANGIAVPAPPAEDLARMRDHANRLAANGADASTPYEALPACRADMQSR